MTVMIPAALLTIFAIVILLAPLMLGNRRQKILAWLLLVTLTVSTMGLYLWRGTPDLPSEPALFETQGPRFETRQRIRQEIALTRELAASPEDTALMLALGTVRLQNGRLEEAIAVLSAAHRQEPGHSGISTKLGAAHYAAALAAFLLEDNRALAEEHFEKARELAPPDAPYREKLLRDMAKFQEET